MFFTAGLVDVRNMGLIRGNKCYWSKFDAVAAGDRRKEDSLEMLKEKKHGMFNTDSEGKCDGRRCLLRSMGFMTRSFSFPKKNLIFHPGWDAPS